MVILPYWGSQKIYFSLCPAAKSLGQDPLVISQSTYLTKLEKNPLLGTRLRMGRPLAETWTSAIFRVHDVRFGAGHLLANVCARFRAALAYGGE
jgi:hypothetical protein